MQLFKSSVTQWTVPLTICDGLSPLMVYGISYKAGLDRLKSDSVRKPHSVIILGTLWSCCWSCYDWMLSFQSLWYLSKYWLLNYSNEGETLSSRHTAVRLVARLLNVLIPIGVCPVHRVRYDLLQLEFSYFIYNYT
jgi:hypothetical protein